MFTLVVSSVLTENFLFFPFISTSQFSVPNLSKEYCEELGKSYNTERKEDGFLTSAKVERSYQCIEQK